MGRSDTRSEVWTRWVRKMRVCVMTSHKMRLEVDFIRVGYECFEKSFLFVSPLQPPSTYEQEAKLSNVRCARAAQITCVKATS